MWNIEDLNAKASNVLSPGRLALGSAVTSLHFSPRCKELLSTHGRPPAPPSSSPSSSESTGGNSAASSIALPGLSGNVSNSVIVHNCPSLRHVTTLSASDLQPGFPVTGSVLNSTATKIVLAVPGESKLKIWDAWGKNKELRRQSSFMDSSTIR